MTSVMKRDADKIVCPCCGATRPKKRELTLREKIEKILTLTPAEKKKLIAEDLAKDLAAVIDDYLKEANR